MKTLNLTKEEVRYLLKLASKNVDFEDETSVKATTFDKLLDLDK